MDSDRIILNIIFVCMLLYLVKVCLTKGALNQIEDDWCDNYLRRLENSDRSGFNGLCYAACWFIYYVVKHLYLLIIAFLIATVKFVCIDLRKEIVGLWKDRTEQKEQSESSSPDDVNSSTDKNDMASQTVGIQQDTNENLNLSNIEETQQETLENERSENNSPATGLEKIGKFIFKVLKICLGVLCIIAILGGCIEIYKEGIVFDKAITMLLCVAVAWLCLKK